MYVLTKEIQSCIFVVWSWCRPVRIIILNWWSESGLNGARARGWTCVVTGMVARGQVLVGSGAGKVNSTWVDVKGPDLHVCLFVCVCVLEWSVGIWMAAGASEKGFFSMDEWKPLWVISGLKQYLRKYLVLGMWGSRFYILVWGRGMTEVNQGFASSISRARDS